MIEDKEFTEALTFLCEYPVEEYCHDAHKAVTDAMEELIKVDRLSLEESVKLLEALQILRGKIDENE